MSNLQSPALDPSQDRQIEKQKMKLTEGGTVDALKGYHDGQDEDEWEQESKNEDNVEDTIRDLTSGDVDLHQIEEPIVAHQYCDASHARRKPNRHRSSQRCRGCQSLAIVVVLSMATSNRLASEI